MSDLGAVGFYGGLSSMKVTNPPLHFKSSQTSFITNRAPPLKSFLKFNQSGLSLESLGDITKDIAGITRMDFVPISKLVRLYDRRTGNLIRETLSNQDGSFTFESLSYSNDFYVVVLDQEPDSIYNAEIADHL